MEPRYQKDGLLPVILQHRATGRVLMLGYMNREAWERTLAEGRVYFYSRSQGKLWLKGETSGGYQHVRDIFLDCDADAALVRVEPAGPVCHTGQETCFHVSVHEHQVNDAGPVWNGLYELIRDRKKNPREGSYTSKLFLEGNETICKKVGEEAAETVVAAMGQSRERVVEEAADLIYHLFVLLADRGLDLEDLEAELLRRRR